MLNYDEYMELIQKRRSVRAFTDEQVSDEDVKKIIRAAQYAPSGLNFQPWEYIVVRDKEVISQLVNLDFSQLKIPMVVQEMMKAKGKNQKMPSKICSAKNASLLIVAVGDTRKMINLPGQMYKYKNNKIKLEKPLPLVDVEGLWYSSMANSFMIMITAAASLGIASQYCTFVSIKAKEKMVRDILQLPDYMRIYDAAAMGYAAYTPRQKYMRPLDDIIHYNHYDESKAQSDEIIYQRALDKADMKYFNEGDSKNI